MPGCHLWTAAAALNTQTHVAVPWAPHVTVARRKECDSCGWRFRKTSVIVQLLTKLIVRGTFCDLKSRNFVPYSLPRYVNVLNSVIDVIIYVSLILKSSFSLINILC